MTADLEKSKKDVDAKHAIGLRWKTRGDGLIAEAKTRQEALNEKEKLVSELNSKVEGLTKELEESKAKIGELEKKVATPAPAASIPAAVPVPAGGANVPVESVELVSFLR